MKNKQSKNKLVIFCKSYIDDIDNFQRLLTTYGEYNQDNIPLVVSVPKSDLMIFKDLVQDMGTVIADESYAETYFTNKRHWGLSEGYINQEICKLSFWETNLANNYLCVDSDTYFIRNFFYSDFMADNSTPYSVLVMDKELNMEHYYKDFGTYRSNHIKKIFDRIGNTDRRLLTCHGMTVMNGVVLSSLKNDFMKKNKLEYRDLIEISPYEFTWYNAWLQKSKIIEIYNVEPFFKTFHMRAEYTFSKLRMISEEDLKEHYVGIVLNSNWQDKPPPQKYGPIGIIHKFIYKLARGL